MKVLLIEDNQETAAYIERGLGEHGHTVDHMSVAGEGLNAGGNNHYDVMIVDRMLPEMDGLSIVKALRGNGVKTPILFLTTMTGIDDRVEGLNAGGDDWQSPSVFLSS